MIKHNVENIKYLQRAILCNDEVCFEHKDGFEEAIRDGFFAIQKPQFVNIEPGLKLANLFYKNTENNNPYTGFKNKEDIYFDREHFQTEHILLDQHSRKKYFPKELNVLCDQMNEIGILILKDFCKKLNIPAKDLEEVTCKVTKNEGTHWFACSHYRSNLRKPGCAIHKDTGFITVLYIDRTGLEAFIDNKWVNIDPIENHFIINFGASFEILTKNFTTPVNAILHRVKEIKFENGMQDRYSFAAFLNPPSHLSLYQYNKHGDHEKYMPVKDFLEEFNKNTWNDKHEQFGIIN